MSRTLALAVAGLLALSTQAGNWPAWRGPDGTGISTETEVLVHWNTNSHVRWRAPLPEKGNSTPIIWRDRVFVTQSDGDRRTVMCFNARTGQLLWQKGPTWTGKEALCLDNPPCSPSPVTDGKRVIAWFGSSGVYSYDYSGRELWHRSLGRPTHQWGYAASPILYRDLCLLQFGPGDPSFLIALNKNNGQTVWQFDFSTIPADAKWEDFGGDAQYSSKPGAAKMSEVAGSWATPLVVRAAGHDELVVVAPLQMMAFAPGTGKRLWTCAGPNIGAYSSPFFGDGIVGLNGNGLKNSSLAIKPGGRGDVTKTHRLWFESRADTKGCLGTAVIYHGHVFQITYRGLAECVDLATGNLVWEQQLTGSGAKNSSWSSPIITDGRIYVPNQNADVFVLRASPTYDCLATNSIGGELMNASLALSNGAIFIRTANRLWCVSAQ